MGFLSNLFNKKNNNQQEAKPFKPSHTSEWDTYLSNIDHIIGSIRLDLGLKSVAPITDLPNLLWIAINMNNPREDGLSSQEESSTLFEIEDSLSDALTSKHTCILAGCITSNKKREFYFYIGDHKDLEEIATQIMSNYVGYDYDIQVKNDENWDTYSDFLYPTTYEHQGILNRRVLNNLKKFGDNFEIPREIDHFLYFNTEDERAIFIKYAEDQGFTVKGIETKDSGQNKYMLLLTKESTINYKQMNECTTNLYEKALELNGEYDGWGCSTAK